MKMKKLLMSFAFLGLGVTALTACGDTPNKVEIVNEDGTTETLTITATKDKEKVAKALNSVHLMQAEEAPKALEVSLKGNLAYQMGGKIEETYAGQKISMSMDMSLNGKLNSTVKVAIDEENPLNSAFSAKADASLDMNVKVSANGEAAVEAMGASVKANAYKDAENIYADYEASMTVEGETQKDSAKVKVTLEEAMMMIESMMGELDFGFGNIEVPETPEMPEMPELSVEEMVEAYGITITATTADSFTLGFVFDEADLGQDIDGNADNNLELITLSMTVNTKYMVPSAMKIKADNLLKNVDLSTAMGEAIPGMELKIKKATFSLEYSMKFDTKVDTLTEAQKAEYVSIAE